MSNIQNLYDTRIRPMAPPERLQLARLILDDLATCESSAGSADTLLAENLAVSAAHIRSPRLAHHGQKKDFTKQIVELASDAGL